MPANRVLVDLDTFLDTRLALCRRLDPEAAHLWVQNGYRHRFSDEFWKVSTRVSEEQYTTAWNKRDASLLRESIATCAHTLLSSVLNSIDWGPHTGDPSNCIEVTVNTAPYALSVVEQQALVEIIETVLPMADKVSLVNIPLWSLHPGQIRDHYDLLVMYNFMEWLRSYPERMGEFELGNIDVLVPRLFARLPEVDSHEWESLKQEDLFTFLSGRLFGRCKLAFQSPHYFSVVNTGPA